MSLCSRNRRHLYNCVLPFVVVVLFLTEPLADTKCRQWPNAPSTAPKKQRTATLPHDWEADFLTIEQRYLSLRQEHNTLEKQLQQQAVLLRKAKREPSRSSRSPTAASIQCAAAAGVFQLIQATAIPPALQNRRPKRPEAPSAMKDASSSPMRKNVPAATATQTSDFAMPQPSSVPLEYFPACRQRRYRNNKHPAGPHDGVVGSTRSWSTTCRATPYWT